VGLLNKGKTQKPEILKTYFGLDPLVTKGSVYRFVAPYPKKDLTLRGSDKDSSLEELSLALAAQPHWEISREAQNEVVRTANALEALTGIVSNIESMQVQDFPKNGMTVQDESIGIPMRGAVAMQHGELLDHTDLHGSLFMPNKPEIALKSDLLAKAYASLQGAGIASVKNNPKKLTRVLTKQDKPAEKDTAPGVKTSASLQGERIEKILAFCKTPRYRSEVQAHVGINNRDYFRKDILNPLIEKGLLRPTLPDKPNSPKQQYSTS
jgi:ATP-dependent DNA helicase RecG